MMVSLVWTTSLLLWAGTTHGFVATTTTTTTPLRQNTLLFAKEGAPQYDKIDAVLKQAEKVAEGSYMLHVETKNNDALDLDYQPGHVLALEMEDLSKDQDDHTKENGGWMRGPYTVSRCQDGVLNVLVKVVGKKTKAFTESQPGTPMRIGGKFKVPILEGVNKEETQKVVLVSTGVGVGPCVGAIELAMEDESFPPIALFASFRDSNEVALKEHLDELVSKHGKKLEWHPIVTSETGRLSSSEENLKLVANCIEGLAIDECHFHLIGNGQMVNEWKAGLEKAGLPAERLTIEQYFNHQAKSDETAIENIASMVFSRAGVKA